MSGWTKPLPDFGSILTESLKVLGNRIVKNSKLKIRGDYIRVITGQTMGSIMSRVEGTELRVTVGTWWGAAFNVRGGFSKFRRATSPEYAKNYRRVSKLLSPAKQSGVGHSHYRPFLFDALTEESKNFRDIVKSQAAKL